MPLSATSRAAAVAAAVQNVQFQATTLNVPRKILVIGTYDPAKTLVVDEVPVQVLSPEDCGDKFGFGFMVHRLVKQAFAGSNGVECWVQPQAEAGGAAASTGDITFTVTGTVGAGTIYMYIAGISVPVAVAAGTSQNDIATAVVAAITANKDLPITAVVNGVTLNQVDVTAKSKGPWGDDISLTFNWGLNEELPDNLTTAVTAMTGGTGIPTMADALDGLGTGDDQNEKFFTDVVHGYGQDTTTLDALSTYNGIGNGFTGNYSKTVARPFRVLDGDVVAGSSGLTGLTALGNGRKTDRTNGILPVPGSPNHPAEVAAVGIGIMARINNDRAAQSYIGQIMPGIIPGALADRWTSDHDNRDTAVKAGISVTKIDNNAVVMQNVLTFYHPDSIPIDSNIYASMRNISIIQNVLDNVRANFAAEKWQGISIVADVTKVSNATDREKARDIDAVLDDLVALATGFEGRAWIYTAAFTIERLQAGGLVTIRAGGIGFDTILPIIISGEGGIFDNLVQADTSLAVLLAA